MGLGFELAMVLDGLARLGDLPDLIIRPGSFCDILLQYHQYHPRNFYRLVQNLMNRSQQEDYQVTDLSLDIEEEEPVDVYTDREEIMAEG